MSGSTVWSYLKHYLAMPRMYGTEITAYFDITWTWEFSFVWEQDMALNKNDMAMLILTVSLYKYNSYWNNGTLLYLANGVEQCCGFVVRYLWENGKSHSCWFCHLWLINQSNFFQSVYFWHGSCLVKKRRTFRFSIEGVWVFYIIIM